MESQTPPKPQWVQHVLFELPKLPCRRCRINMVEAGRVLCEPCIVYYRELRRAKARPMPPHPTPIMPGPAKVAVLAYRWSSGCQLWHPDDAKYTE